MPFAAIASPVPTAAPRTQTTHEQLRRQTMDWMGQIGSILERYRDGTPNDGVEDDYDQVARTAPPQVIRGGLADAFRSEQTPPFPQMFSQMFGNSSGPQRAGILNMLLKTLGPQILAGILARRMGGGGVTGGSMGGGGGTGGGLGGILGDLMSGRKSEVTPEEAEQIDPKVVEEIAAEAEKKDPSIIDNVSDFYARNPTLVKGLGAVALAFLMSRVAKGGPF
jgi:hypothetical protein